MKTPRCVECGESREANFYPSYKNRCKACCIKRGIAYQQAHPEQVRKYRAKLRATPEYQRKQAEFYKEWYAKNGRNRATNYKDIIYLWQKEHPESPEASKIVKKAIKDGLLERPLTCALCGKKGRINGHHEDYTSPYNVLWVCSSCHKKIHLGILQMTLENSSG